MGKYLIVHTLLASLLGCTQAPQIPLLGGDRDEHGCIGSAGYSWDPVTEACVRPWEQK